MNSIIDSDHRLPIRYLNIIFDRHPGAKKALAAENGWSQPYVTKVLRKYKGAYNDAIHTAADRLGRRLLAEEREAKTSKKAPQRDPTPLTRAMTA